MSRDRTETTDPTSQNPAKVAELREASDRWAARTNVRPWAEVQQLACWKSTRSTVMQASRRKFIRDLAH